MFVCRQLSYEYGDRTEESVLVIQDFQSEDLNRDYHCSVRNEKGSDTRRAQLKEEGEEGVNTSVSSLRQFGEFSCLSRRCESVLSPTATVS